MNTAEFYEELNMELSAASSDEKMRICILANAAALLYERLSDVNWAGFYLMRGGVLILGPFAGKPACTVIEPGKGVCGTAVAENAVQRVDNVHEFSGHIACDSASNSEIVLPVYLNGEIYGVLDIDSPLYNRFTPADEDGLRKCVSTLENSLESAQTTEI